MHIFYAFECVYVCVCVVQYDKIDEKTVAALLVLLDASYHTLVILGRGEDIMPSY